MLKGEAADIHGKLWDAYSHLKWSLDSYRELFGEQEAREILDPYGGEIFYMYIWPALWRDLILQLARLTDSAKGQRNISLDRLLDFCGDDDELRRDIKSAVGKAKQATSSARDLRNKVIAHTDRRQALAGSGNSVGPKTVSEVADATDAIYRVLHEFNLRRLLNHTSPDVAHPLYATRFINTLHIASRAIRWIADFLTDEEDPETVDHEAMKRLMKCLGHEYDPLVHPVQLMGLWQLGRQLPPPRSTNH